VSIEHVLSANRKLSRNGLAENYLLISSKRTSWAGITSAWPVIQEFRDSISLLSETKGIHRGRVSGATLSTGRQGWLQFVENPKEQSYSFREADWVPTSPQGQPICCGVAQGASRIIEMAADS
jgi:hypothetical protein